ncbi:MAG: CRISPR-associated protein, partial [Cyanobacteria bacterium J06638_28]
IEERIGENITFYYGRYAVEDPVHPSNKLSLTVDHEAIHDPDYILHLVNAIYRHGESLGLSETDMIVDITGGTKPLGVGAFLACARPERRLEYITTVNGDRQLLEIRVAYRLKAIR